MGRGMEGHRARSIKWTRTQRRAHWFHAALDVPLPERRQARRDHRRQTRALGVKPGVPDLLMPVPSGKNPGLAWSSRAQSAARASRRTSRCAFCWTRPAGWS
jgi:hypothetical protein